MIKESVILKKKFKMKRKIFINKTLKIKIEKYYFFKLNL